MRRRQMKSIGSIKWIIIAIVIAIPVLVLAQTWWTANQKTMEWDAVTTLTDGSPLPAGSTIKYICYIKTVSNSTPVQVGASDIPRFTYTFTVEDKYFLGVKSQRLISGAVVTESPISWSNDPLYAQGGTIFGVSFYYLPASPGGLRAQ